MHLHYIFANVLLSHRMRSMHIRFITQKYFETEVQTKRTFSGSVEEVLVEVYDVEYFKGEDGDKVVLAVTVVTPPVEESGEVRIYIGGGHWVSLLDLSSRQYDRRGTPSDKFTPVHVLAAAGGSGLVWLMLDIEDRRPVLSR